MVLYNVTGNNQQKSLKNSSHHREILHIKKVWPKSLKNVNVRRLSLHAAQRKTLV